MQGLFQDGPFLQDLQSCHKLHKVVREACWELYQGLNMTELLTNMI